MNGNSDGKTTLAGVLRVARKTASIGAKVVLGLIACAVLLVFFKTSTRAPQVKADSAVYYPSTCLAGWQNPQNASAQSEIPAGDTNPSDFTTNNSAFLASSTAAQIFCGYFPVDSHTNPPSKVTVTFNWAIGSVQAPPIQTSSTTSQTSPVQTSSGGDGSLSSSSGLIIATSTGFTVATSTDTSSDPGTTSPTTPAVEDTTPAPTDSSASSSAPTSFLYKIIDAFTTKALADSSGFSQNAFFQISYTTDGTNWTPAGTVSQGNFIGYSIVVPVSSWDDLKNLQVKVETLPTVSGKPDVYLESVSLNVNYNGALSDFLSQGVDTVNNAANAAADAINAIVQPTVPVTPAPPAPPEMKWIKKMSFDFGANQIATRKDLPWYPSDISKARIKHPFDARLSLKKNIDASSLVVSGTCDAPNFVVLIYRNVDDYINRPASFLYNAANPCDANGAFSFDISKLTTSIPDGSYYLLVGSEGSAGTWIPISPVVPITINSNAIQVPVTTDTATTTQ